MGVSEIREYHQLPSTKGASRRGGMEGVLVDDPVLIAALRALVSNLQPGDSLLGMSCAQYRALFGSAANALSLGEDFKPYSLRRGGASSHFRRHANMSLTMDIGRWSDVRTAKTYVNTALLELTSMRFMDSEAIRLASDEFLARVARFAE